MEPVEVVKDRGNLISAVGGSEHVGSRVLDVLKFIEDYIR